jgi:hypothetical protein
VSRQGPAAAAPRFDGKRKLARRHPPETLRRKPQHPEADADRLPPGKRFDAAFGRYSSG